ncbi:hypothetical protein V6N12_040817 [Hibiscus sabdariffa]|uniref:Uncharacterized protein n=1 Tax=Hibiscus sabdariffa TaxID=183260 RepID=A0ABR2E5F0_9ROSI
MISRQRFLLGHRERAAKMAIGGFSGVDAPVGSFSGKITLSAVITCIVAASGSLIFGYGIGISGVAF